MILIADDDESSATILSKVLLHHGYDVITAADGLEALKKFKKNKEKITIIIMDVHMPKMDGKLSYDAITSIKPHIPVIFINNEPSDTITPDYLSHVNGIMLIKPFTMKRLLTHLKFLTPFEKKNCHQQPPPTPQAMVK